MSYSCSEIVFPQFPENLKVANMRNGALRRIDLWYDPLFLYCNKMEEVVSIIVQIQSLTFCCSIETVDHIIDQLAI